MTSLERRALAELVDGSVRRLIEGRKFCSRCERWLPRDEYSHDRRYCVACEALRVLKYRERQDAAA